MNEFLNALLQGLKHLPPEEREEILQDYREHFEIGLANGKTQTQIVMELGEPEGIIKMYTALNASNVAEKTNKPWDAVKMVTAILKYRVGGGTAIGLLYLTFILCMLPIFVLAASLILTLPAFLYLAMVIYSRAFVVYAVLSIFCSIFFGGSGVLLLMGARKAWGMGIRWLSGLAGRMMGRAYKKGEMK